MLRDDEVQLPGGPRLGVRRVDGPLRPFLLVHGLASNARLWDAVARGLGAAGHEVVAVDQRGHGRSEQCTDGYTTARCACDLAALCRETALTGERAPIAVGQSWGGNVVLTLAAQRGTVAGLALVDGGWISLRSRFATFEDCWAVLAPPLFDGTTLEQLRARLRSWRPGWSDEAISATLANFREAPDGSVSAHLSRHHHKEILRSMYSEDPRRLYARVSVPVLLAPAVAPEDPMAAEPLEALALLPDAQVSWYAGGDHDLHAEQPERVVADLLALTRRVEERRG